MSLMEQFNVGGLIRIDGRPGVYKVIAITDDRVDLYPHDEEAKSAVKVEWTVRIAS